MPFKSAGIESGCADGGVGVAVGRDLVNIQDQRARVSVRDPGWPGGRRSPDRAAGIGVNVPVVAATAVAYAEIACAVARFSGTAVLTRMVGSSVGVATTALNGGGVTVPNFATTAVAVRIWAAAVTTFFGMGVGMMMMGVTAFVGTGVKVPVVMATAVAYSA